MKGTRPGGAPVPNIGPRERRRRRIGGVAALVLAGLLAVPLAGAPLPLRALLFLPLLMAALGWFQAREKT